MPIILDLKTNYIKRCVGIPGDEIKIENTAVFINNERLIDPPEMQFKYYLVTNEQINPRVFKKYDITDIIPGNGYYIVDTSPEVADKLKTLPFIREVTPYLREKDDAEMRIYPDGSKYPWNTDFYGPLKIPMEGVDSYN